MQEERYSMSILGANEDTKKQNKKTKQKTI
jgi:hypothetical protein